MKRYIRTSNSSNKKSIKSSVEKDIEDTTEKEYWDTVYEEMDNPDPYEHLRFFLSDVSHQTKEFDSSKYEDIEFNDEIEKNIDKFASRYFIADEKDDLQRMQQIGKDLAVYLKTLK